MTTDFLSDLEKARGEAALEIQRAGEPRRIGPYRILRILGQGGMGTVYLGLQEEPVRREVALKVMSTTRDKRAYRRFVVEFQALARLNHPNVASMYEVGVTEDGYPFVAMEPVDGTGIIDWCDQRRLSIRERVELFLGVCAGVRHAHEKGILHRDIKPANILVQEVDGKPTAKVIDFGIARALDGPLWEGGQVTVDQQLIGSPPYMSPEAMAGGDLDTRSDVYSLGLVLYELLVGVRPFDGTSLTEVMTGQSEGGFKTPSSRYHVLWNHRSVDKVARSRGLSREDLVRKIRGDLDAVVTQAVAHNREQRYGSAAEFAADLNRYLNHVPVEAMPAGTLYAASLFVRRNKAAVIGAALVLITLVLGVVGTTYAWLQARQAEARATENFTHAKQAVDDFLTSVSENELMEFPRAQELRRQLLGRALSYYEGFIEQHRDDPELQYELGQAYLRVARINDEFRLHQVSLPAYQNAVEIFEPLVTDIPRNGEYRYHHVVALYGLSWALYETGDAAGSFNLGKEVVARQEALVKDFPTQVKYRELHVQILNDRSEALEVTGQDEAAVQMAGRALEIQQALTAETGDIQHREELAAAHTRFATFLTRVDRHEEALEHHESALELWRDIQVTDGEKRKIREHYAFSLSSYGLSSIRAGLMQEAQRKFELSLGLWQDLRRDYPSIQTYTLSEASDYFRLSLALGGLGRYGEAVQSAEKSLENIRRLVLQNPQSLRYQLRLGRQSQELAALHLEYGEFEPTVRVARQAVDVLESYTRDQPEVQDAKHHLSKAYGNLAEGLHGSGSTPEAIAALKRRRDLLEQISGDRRFQSVLDAEKTQVAELLVSWQSE